MIALHTVQPATPAIPREMAAAAAMLFQQFAITRFRLTEQPYTGERGNWDTPVQYFYNHQWDNWTNDSITSYSDNYPAPTEGAIEHAYTLFEPMP